MYLRFVSAWDEGYRNVTGIAQVLSCFVWGIPPVVNWSIRSRLQKAGLRIRDVFSHIPDPNFSIPDPNFFHPPIPDPDPAFLPIPDPGVEKAPDLGSRIPDPQSRIRICNTGKVKKFSLFSIAGWWEKGCGTGARQSGWSERHDVIPGEHGAVQAARPVAAGPPLPFPLPFRLPGTAAAQEEEKKKPDAEPESGKAAPPEPKSEPGGGQEAQSAAEKSEPRQGEGQEEAGGVAKDGG
jgi:hypothetical protein